MSTYLYQYLISFVHHSRYYTTSYIDTFSDNFFVFQLITIISKSQYQSKVYDMDLYKQLGTPF